MILSIIIPIYKVEKYVRGTLDSIYNQEFDESMFEVICVNDGTPDSSMNIVKEFELTHKNLHVINQENQGLSCARNAGLKVAKGDYIWFVDSDDKVTSRSLSLINSFIGKSIIEVVGFDMLKENELTGVVTLQKITICSSTKYHIISSGTFFYNKIQTCPVQRFIFSRKFLNENNLKFFPGIYYEDTEFMIRVLCIVKKIVLTNVALYCYLERSKGSIMSSPYKFAFTQSQTQRIENWKRINNYSLFSKQYAIINDAIFKTTCDIINDANFSNKEFQLYYKTNNIELRKNAFKGLFSIQYSTLRKLFFIPLIVISPSIYRKVHTLLHYCLVKVDK